jgi:hypothetical protein
MPDPVHLIGLYQILFAVIAMTLAGRLALAGRGEAWLHLVAGWGVLCLLLTAWGLVTTASLRVPAAAFALAGLGGLVIGARGSLREQMIPVGRVMIIAAPLLALMADVDASQVDVLALMLPNAAFLVDHAAFPTQGAAIVSDAPVAPYNTEFVPFLGSLAGGGLAANGLSLFTVLLHLVPALLFARVITGGQGRPGWRAIGLGLMLATLINPGFVPRVSLSGYGEAPIAITLMVAAWLAVEVMDGLEGGIRWPAALLPLALTLAALVNIKQQSIGMLVAVVPALLIVAGRDPGIGWRNALRAFTAAALPAAALYLAWKGFVLLKFPKGELKSFPIAQWAWGGLGGIFLGMAKVVVEKPFHFGCVAMVFGLAAWRRQQMSAATRRLVLLACLVFVFYTGFIVLTFLGHFRGEHSYFRYNTQLSLLVVLALVAVAREMVTLPLGWRQRLGGAAIVAALVAPLALSSLLRFDRHMPQPRLRLLAHNLAGELREDDRIALVLPGDNDAVGTALGTLLRHTAPRRRFLDIAVADSADAAAFAKVAKAGYRLALLSCTNAAAPAMGLPADAAALLSWSEEGWKPVKVWPYPPVPPHRKWEWTWYLANEPFCL